ncbi:MAG: hypothetical protein WCD70_12170 [Alphaproteobacteria bacterium]
MKRLVLAILVVFLGVASVAAPAHADRGFYRGGGGGFLLGLGVGALCCGYAPYYSPYYYSGYPGYYYPPAVVYSPPPVTYIQPPATYYVPPASAAVDASQSSADFVDKKGRTCRNFQTSVNGAAVSGTACLQPDGTWRTVGE